MTLTFDLLLKILNISLSRSIRPSLKNCWFAVTLPTHSKPSYSNFFIACIVDFFLGSECIVYVIMIIVLNCTNFVCRLQMYKWQVILITLLALKLQMSSFHHIILNTEKKKSYISVKKKNKTKKSLNDIKGWSWDFSRCFNALKSIIVMAK